jgi:hypothetical protein
MIPPALLLSPRHRRRENPSRPLPQRMKGSRSANPPSVPSARAMLPLEGPPCHFHPPRFLLLRSGRYLTRVGGNSLLNGHTSPLRRRLLAGCLCPPHASPAPLDPFGAMPSMFPAQPWPAAQMALRSHGLHRDRRQDKLAAGCLHRFSPTRVRRPSACLSTLTTPRGWHPNTSPLAHPCQSHRIR